MAAEGGRGQRLRLYSLMSLQNLCNYTARMAIAFTVPFIVRANGFSELETSGCSRPSCPGSE